MRALFIAWAAIVAQIAAWTFAPATPPPRPPTPPQQQQRNDGRAFGANEDILLRGRASLRQTALRALGAPWSSFCTETGRKIFINDLGNYYNQRQNEIERYPENFGRPGADYIAGQWASTDDRRIDRLTEEAYGNGYLKPGDFDAVASKMIAAVLAGERVIGKGCAR